MGWRQRLEPGRELPDIVERCESEEKRSRGLLVDREKLGTGV